MIIFSKKSSFLRQLILKYLKKKKKHDISNLVSSDFRKKRWTDLSNKRGKIINKCKKSLVGCLLCCSFNFSLDLTCFPTTVAWVELQRLGMTPFPVDFLEKEPNNLFL